MKPAILLEKYKKALPNLLIFVYVGGTVCIFTWLLIKNFPVKIATLFFLMGACAMEGSILIMEKKLEGIKQWEDFEKNKENSNVKISILNYFSLHIIPRIYALALCQFLVAIFVEVSFDENLNFKKTTETPIAGISAFVLIELFLLFAYLFTNIWININYFWQRCRAYLLCIFIWYFYLG